VAASLLSEIPDLDHAIIVSAGEDVLIEHGCAAHGSIVSICQLSSALHGAKVKDGCGREGTGGEERRGEEIRGGMRKMMMMMRVLASGGGMASWE
jgi:hypothetical protein